MGKNKTGVGSRPIAPIADKLDFVVSEAYNLLRTNLILSIPGVSGGKIIGLTSAAPQDGKSYTSINLSYALAKDGHKTLLVSSDLRKPTIEKIIGIKSELGMADILAGKTDFESCVVGGTLHENMFVLASGTLPPMPSELLGSKRFLELTEELKAKYDYVIMDLPPILSVADPIIVSNKIDGVMVVIKHGVSRKRNIIKIINQLRYANAHILGFVYNSYQSGSRYYKKGKYNDYYKYRSYYSSEERSNANGDSNIKGRKK